MQAMTLAFGAAAMVAVPLAVALGIAARVKKKRERRVSEGRRSRDTAIDLTAPRRRSESADGGERRRSRGRSGGSGRSSRSGGGIDLFTKSREPSPEERP